MKGEKSGNERRSNVIRRNGMTTRKENCDGEKMGGGLDFGEKVMVKSTVLL